ncbi:MAG: hypothetical protein ACXAC5_11315 [Promethearchaeota archaeon]|jgi:hypothetical protein
MVYKTKIKRFQLSIDIVLIAFFAMASAVMLASAYGSVCVVYDVGAPFGRFVFPWVGRYRSIYVVMNFITWIFAFVWGVIVWAFLTKKRWAHWGAAFTAIIGTISGIIPAFISDTEGFTIPFEGIGSPNWGRALMNIVVLLILGIILIIPATRKGLLSFTAKAESRMSGNVARQLIMMSLFFFWLAAFSFLGSEFMRNAHVVGGINYWQTVEIQFFGGIATALIGSSMLAGGLILHQIKRPTSIIKPLPLNN